MKKIFICEDFVYETDKSFGYIENAYAISDVTIYRKNNIGLKGSIVEKASEVRLPINMTVLIYPID